VLAMRPGLAKIIEKVRISWYNESPEADRHRARNDYCINYADSWSLKRVLWLSQIQSSHRGTSNCGCEATLELHSVVARVRLPIMGIHTRVVSNPKIQSIPATLHNSG
jgi:hypothetical protein